MKIVLGIFCALMVLFAGGCAVILLGNAAPGDGGAALMLSLVPGAIAVLNAVALLALLGRAGAPRGVFHVLAVLDFLAAGALLLIWLPLMSGIQGIAILAAPLTLAILLKGVFSILVARRLAKPPSEG